jgi:hypothetical protein
MNGSIVFETILSRYFQENGQLKEPDHPFMLWMEFYLALMPLQLILTLKQRFAGYSNGKDTEMFDQVRQL